MTETAPAQPGVVKTQTMLLGITVALAVGFVVGVVFGVYKTTSNAPIRTSRPTAAPRPAPASTQDESVVASLLELTKQKPGDFNAWVQLGNAYFDMDRHTESIAAYRKALQINPRDANVLTDMGVMYRRSGKSREAVTAFEQAMAVDPAHEPSRFNKGIVLMHDLKDFSGAVTAWEDLLRVNPAATTSTGESVAAMVEKIKAMNR